MFCKCFHKLKSCPEKAAIKAGYSLKLAKQTANSLLKKDEIVKYIKMLELKDKKEKILNFAISNLKKLTTSPPNDAVILATNYSDMSKEEIKKLDLFQLSEIKKLKDGGFEFKFIDKTKTIESLVCLLNKFEETDDSQIDGFLNALNSNQEQ